MGNNSQNLEALLLQKKELDKQIDFLTKAKKLDAIAQIQRLMITYDIACEELQRKVPKTTSKAPVKYQKNGFTWTGRGRKPFWVENHLNAGETLESIEVSTDHDL